MTNNKPDITNILDAIEQLPPMPGVVVNMLNMIDDPDVSYNDLIKSIDVAVSTKLLQVANSAYYKTYQNIQSLEHAFAILGLDAIKNMLVGINVTTILSADQKNSTFDYKKFWKYSVQTAQFSRILAKLIRYPELSKVYTIGLIHDMGRIVIAKFLPEKFNEIIELSQTGKYSICDAEEKVLGMNHSLIGGKMAEKWELSREMTDVIKFHATPEMLQGDIDAYKISMIVNTSEKIVNEIGLKLSEDLVNKSQTINLFILELLKNTSSQLEEQKVLSAWANIILNEVGEIENEVSQILGTLFR